MFYGNIGNKRVAFLEGLLCAKDIASQFTKESYLIPPPTTTTRQVLILSLFTDEEVQTWRARKWLPTVPP